MSYHALPTLTTPDAEGLSYILWIPNAFTPETALDNLNTTFQPKLNCPIANYSLKIYDRWGALVFETSKPEQGWNGQIGNKPAMRGTYVWMLSMQYSTGRKVDEHGIVNLLR